MSTDTWIRLMCGMMINAVTFGVGAIAVLATPVLAAHAAYLLPAVVVLSFVLGAVLSGPVARRMRVRNWGREGWRRGDFISG